jgi:hypothetical protein
MSRLDDGDVSSVIKLSSPGNGYQCYGWTVQRVPAVVLGRRSVGNSSRFSEFAAFQLSLHRQSRNNNGSLITLASAQLVWDGHDRGGRGNSIASSLKGIYLFICSSIYLPTYLNRGTRSQVVRLTCLLELIGSNLVCDMDVGDFIQPLQTNAWKNCVFWDVTPCGFCKNRRIGGT